MLVGNIMAIRKEEHSLYVACRNVIVVWPQMLLIVSMLMRTSVESVQSATRPELDMSTCYTCLIISPIRMIL